MGTKFGNQYSSVFYMAQSSAIKTVRYSIWPVFDGADVTYSSVFNYVLLLTCSLPKYTVAKAKEAGIVIVPPLLLVSYSY